VQNMAKINIYERFSDRKVLSEYKKISVIIPNYNYASFLNERIDSIIHQTYTIYELIVLDDYSTDDSIEVIQNKLKSITEIKTKLIINTENSGLVFSQWQKGIKEATGDYFWICEADDSCEPTFLEKTMKGFEDSKVVLSYSDSTRIDDHNNIIRKNCQDLYNMFQSDHWNHNFINEGSDEVIHYLSVLNTILNVSGVVWRNDSDIVNIIEKAKNFKIAGDWYIYVKLLERGNVAFCSECLNYYRKHEGSVTSSINTDVEYDEIVKIQEMVAKQYHVGMDVYKWQRLRRSYMEQNVSKKIHKKRIAWVIPFPGKGSGGHRTIIQNVNALIRHGYECDIYAESPAEVDDETVAKLIDEYYEVCAAKVYAGFSHHEKYDLLFATGWQSLNYVQAMETDKKAYFIQDYEPWFFPMGDEYLNTEDSYRLGYQSITIGKWLSAKLKNEFNVNAQHFDFCADVNIYKPIMDITKENAICYVLQPEKPRRVTTIALKALKIVKNRRPDIKIYLYGSNVNVKIPFEAESLGIISVDECNKLYNKCKIGLCLSASNPSRIPFEMMAAGLPVVELYRENNLYDLPDGGVCLAESSPVGIAYTLLKLLGDESKLKKMSVNGYEYMKDYPLEKGFLQFETSVDKLINNETVDSYTAIKTYRQNCDLPDQSFVKECNEILQPVLPTPAEISLPVRTKHRVIRELKRVYHHFKHE